MPQHYYDTIHLIERLHRHCLDVMKVELDNMGVKDINNVQTLILYNIGDDELTVGELTARGYYLGSNVSYNVKKMVENGYLEQKRSIHDRRSVVVKLSEKGNTLHTRVRDVFERQVEDLRKAGIPQEDLTKVNETLVRLERFWSNRMGFNYQLTSAA